MDDRLLERATKAGVRVAMLSYFESMAGDRGQQLIADMWKDALVSRYCPSSKYITCKYSSRSKSLKLSA